MIHCCNACCLNNLCWSFSRCIDALCHGVNAYKERTKKLQARALVAFRDNSLLNMYASILEDAPQVILQLYIMKASGKGDKISEGDI